MSSKEIEVVHPAVKKAIDDVRLEYAIDIWYTKPSVSRGQGMAGEPDFLIFINNVFIGLECKWDMWINHGHVNQRLSTNKKILPTSAQTARLRLIKFQGGLGLVIDRNNMHKVKELLILCLENKDTGYFINYFKMDIEYYASNLKEINI